MKKTYLVPGIEVTVFHGDAILAGASKLDPNEDNQTVTPSEEEYDGEFSSNRNNYNVWDDEEEDY
jgi:hypothetical protein